MMKFVTVVGARPQFIKAANITRRLREVAQEVLIHTGQHYDAGMSEIFFRQLCIPDPDYNLGVGSASHGEQTGEMLKRIEPILVRERPDGVIVYGDTNSTLAGALAASKLHIPVAHVEAGLRSFNRAMPEEVNRVLTDHLSSLLFAPTDTAVRNLQREGITDDVHLVGDVMYDAALEHLTIAEERSQILDRLGLSSRAYALATVHRAENTDSLTRLDAILDALEIISVELPVVFAVHPRTRQAIRSRARVLPERLLATEPLPYLDMILLESRARFIVTDSGGVQKEAFFFRVPCITVRDETEWLETVATGWNTLAGADPRRILNAVQKVKAGEKDLYPYGSGDACRRIVKVILGQVRWQNKCDHRESLVIQMPSEVFNSGRLGGPVA